MADITPYTIAVPDERIQQLNQKLQLASFPDEIDAVDWEMGVPLQEMKRLVTAWRETFDWRAQEKKLNDQLDQYTVPINVDGFGELDIHFLHHRSGKKNAIPLLFIHGWPGNFLEATKIIPLLTKGDDGPYFDVVAPSLPNFGFSQGVQKKRFGLAQYAETLHKLMLALDYEEYAIQGGDWGSMLSRTIAQYYPEHVQAIHLNFAPVMPPYPWRDPLRFLRSLVSVPFSAKDRKCIARTLQYLGGGNAYMKVQESRPQTLGYSLHDSPVGLLAWIYDKLHSWSSDYQWTDEEILTWVSIYYFSRAGPTASTRIYYEASAPAPESAKSKYGDATKWTNIEQSIGAVPGRVRLAIAQFKDELIQWPMFWYGAMGNVVKETEFDRGGHFAAWEVPELLVGDLKEFMGRGGGAYGAVTGKDGY